MRWWPWLLAVLVVVAYLPSLSGGFLNWDDPWLIQDSVTLRSPSLQSLRTIFFRLDFASRMDLGAEYLPVRDVTVWLDYRIHAASPQWMRVENLALWLVAVLALRVALRASLRDRWMAEVATLWFALHPVHVESVAWLAGRKDVLAMAAIALALSSHARARESRARWLVPLFVLIALLSKSMSVVALPLLFAQDLLRKRRFDPWIYGPTTLITVAAFLLHRHVGSVVGMTDPILGGSHLVAMMTMGAVWPRYVASLLWPPLLSIVQDVPILRHWELASVMGWGLLVAWGLAGLALWRRGRPLVLAAAIWFLCGLLPVSQVLVTLQNHMADRYLLFAMMGPGLLLAGWFAQFEHYRPWIAAGLTVALAWTTSVRADLFADSEAVFADATRKTQLSPTAPFMLARALEDKGEDSRAEAAYREVLRRVRPEELTEPGRRSTNNLARLLARRGALGEAEAVLRRGRQLWPEDPKILGNLAQVLARMGRVDEAKVLFDELARQHPDYEYGRRMRRRLKSSLDGRY